MTLRSCAHHMGRLNPADVEQAGCAPCKSILAIINMSPFIGCCHNCLFGRCGCWPASTLIMPCTGNQCGWALTIRFGQLLYRRHTCGSTCIPCPPTTHYDNVCPIPCPASSHRLSNCRAYHEGEEVGLLDALPDCVSRANGLCLHCCLPLRL